MKRISGAAFLCSILSSCAYNRMYNSLNQQYGEKPTITGRSTATVLDIVTAPVQVALLPFAKKTERIPLPEKTIYNDDPRAREAYLQAYAFGYGTTRDGTTPGSYRSPSGPYHAADQKGYRDGIDRARKDHLIQKP